MKSRTIAAVLALTLIAGAAFAQTNTGTTIGQFMLIEPDARIAGMGNAGVSMYEGLEAAYYNPAAIGQLKGSEVLFSHSAWFAGISYDYVAAALPMRDWGQMYAAVTSLNSGEMDVRTVDQPLGTGERFSVSDVALSLGFGRQISPRFSAGGQVNFVDETIWHSSATTVTFNIGTLYRLSANGLRIGSSLSNFGTRGAFSGRDLDFTYDNVPGSNGDNSTLPATRATDAFSVPVLFRVGLGLPVRLTESSQVLLVADAFHPNDNSESVSLGGECSMNDVLAFRAGWQELFLKDSEFGLTLGTGLHARLETIDCRVNYAWADAGRLGSTQRVTVGVNF